MTPCVHIETSARAGDNSKVAETLRFLSDANRRVGLYEEGIGQAREALEIEERLTAGCKTIDWFLKKQDRIFLFIL